MTGDFHAVVGELYGAAIGEDFDPFIFPGAAEGQDPRGGGAAVDLMGSGSACEDGFQAGVVGCDVSVAPVFFEFSSEEPRHGVEGVAMVGFA